MGHDAWGIEEHYNGLSYVKAMMEVDGLDAKNLVSAELILRRLQTIEYSHSDRLREKSGKGGGRLTLEEQAAFGGTARLESKLMIDPKLLDHARVDIEREALLAKNLVKAREAREALRKKG